MMTRRMLLKVRTAFYLTSLVDRIFAYPPVSERVIFTSLNQNYGRSHAAQAATPTENPQESVAFFQCRPCKSMRVNPIFVLLFPRGPKRWPSIHT
ncbi:hypothetical protein BJX61DRAFT_492134 [Aspergillus egyptiacus]|nr:hypothetical protein BJX61DRAFT_492134 [Aspergillus egyptiacus]